jgi:HlyD family secretion protein
MSRLAVLAGVVAVALLTTASLAGDDSKSLPIKLITHKVKPERLEPQIIERGTLESANNSHLICRVKALTSNATVATTIKWVIDDGSLVKRGQLVVELDSSALEEVLKTRRITRDTADLNLAQGNEQLAITRSQNESDLTAARLMVQLAELDLEKYLKGDLVQVLEDLKGRQIVAEGNVQELEEALEEVQSQLKEKLASEKQVRTARRRLQAAKLALAKIKLEHETLEKYTRPRTELDLRGKIATARQAVENAQQLAKGKETLARQEVDARKAVYQQEAARVKEIEEEISKCKLFAPRDGMVIYDLPEQSRIGSGPPISIVAQGEPVREGQKLISIPDLGRMQFETRIPEALVSQVRPGMPAVLRVDALPNMPALGCKVSQVAVRPATRDWLTADEKVYSTVFTIEGSPAFLKPGMSATVTLSLGRAREGVLAVPTRALIGRGAFGKTASCLVLTKEGPEEREVLIGMRNAEIAEVLAGLREGDEVIANPQLLLTDIRDRIRFLQGGRGLPRR